MTFIRDTRFSSYHLIICLYCKQSSRPGVNNLARSGSLDLDDTLRITVQFRRSARCLTLVYRDISILARAREASRSPFSSRMLNVFPPFSTEHAPRTSVSRSRGVIPQKREHEKCSCTVTMPPLGSHSIRAPATRAVAFRLPFHVRR